MPRSVTRVVIAWWFCTARRVNRIAYAAHPRTSAATTAAFARRSLAGPTGTSAPEPGDTESGAGSVVPRENAAPTHAVHAAMTTSVNTGCADSTEGTASAVPNAAPPRTKTHALLNRTVRMKLKRLPTRRRTKSATSVSATRTPRDARQCFRIAYCSCFASLFVSASGRRVGLR
ncbi:MAG: hypothetical protein U0414_02285 [Polyangiaceae bacterium]